MELSHKNKEKYDFIVKCNIELLKNYSLSSKAYILKQYEDPDGYISEVINNFIMTSDGICGIKYLLKHYVGNYEISEVYRILRSKIIIWPCHSGSINQRRYQKFRDRIDFTLFDISNVYNEKHDRPFLTYTLIKKTSLSYKWLVECFDDFIDFIKEMGFEKFVNGTNVYNLAVGNGREEVIKHSKEYRFGQEVNKNYLNNLIDILKNEFWSASFDETNT